MDRKELLERRKFKRFNVEAQVYFRVKGKRKEEIPSEKISGISRNISIAGICFTSELKLKAGSQLDLEIYFPSESKPIYLEGEVRWSQPVPRELGQVKYDTGVSLFTIDKSDKGRFVSGVLNKQKQVEEALRETRDYLEKLYDYASAPIIVWDPVFRITRFNRAFEHLTGYAAYEVVGQNLGMLFPEASREESLNKIKRILKGEHWKSVEIPILCKNSDIRLVLWNSANIYAGDGKTLLATIAHGVDITERKKFEIKLKEAMEIKSQFVSMVSHELRTPLTAIGEAIGIVLDGSAGKINTEQKDFLEIAKRNVDRLARLISDVLDFRKLETGKMGFNFQKNNINEVVKEVHRTMLSPAEEKGLEFILKLDRNLPRIKFDKDKITQVLTNLVENAIHFTQHGQVALSTAREGENTICVFVEDTGPGIKKKDLPKLFHRFEQLEGAKGRKIGGTGLGLAISKEIISGHEGKIWVKSKLGKGTTFYFLLPIKERRG